MSVMLSVFFVRISAVAIQRRSRVLGAVAGMVGVMAIHPIKAALASPGLTEELAYPWTGFICLLVGLAALGRMLACIREDDLIRVGLREMWEHNWLLSMKVRADELSARRADNPVEATPAESTEPSWWADELDEWNGNDGSVVVKGEIKVEGGRVEFCPKKTVQAAPPATVEDPNACIKEDLSCVLDEIIEMWDEQIKLEEAAADFMKTLLEKDLAPCWKQECEKRAAAQVAVLDEYEEEIERLEVENTDLRYELARAEAQAGLNWMQAWNIPHPNQRLSAAAWLAKWDIK